MLLRINISQVLREVVLGPARRVKKRFGDGATTNMAPWRPKRGAGRSRAGCHIRACGTASLFAPRGCTKRSRPPPSPIRPARASAFHCCRGEFSTVRISRVPLDAPKDKVEDLRVALAATVSSSSRYERDRQCGYDEDDSRSGERKFTGRSSPGCCRCRLPNPASSVRSYARRYPRNHPGNHRRDRCSPNPGLPCDPTRRVS